MRTRQTKKDSLTKPSEPEKVDAYMAKLKHPLTDVVAALRKVILRSPPRAVKTAGKSARATRI